MEHFGVTVHPGKYGLELSRDKYALINKKNSFYMKFPELEEKKAYLDESGKYYTEEWCQSYRELCLKNFDLNMNFFSSLDHNEFEKELEQFLKNNKSFVEVSDLKKYENVKGYYLMILDKYCQIYIGTTENIKKRIQQHWTQQKSFDRLLCPMYAVEKSVLSIDSFRALDTTRIYAYETRKTFDYEAELIKAFSSKFVANRIGGGKLENGYIGFLQAVVTLNSRGLNTI